MAAAAAAVQQGVPAAAAAAAPAPPRQLACGGVSEVGVAAAAPPPPLPPQRWVQRHVSVSFGKRAGFCCYLKAEARLPLPAPLMYELLTHPDNEVFMRNLDRCTYRRVLADDGCGRMRVEVEHETTVHFLMFHNKVRTPLLVEQDAGAGIMRFRLGAYGSDTPAAAAAAVEYGDEQPHCCAGINSGSSSGGGGGGGSGSVRADAGSGAGGSFGQLSALEGCWTVVADGPCSSLLCVEQAVQPWGLPPMLGGAIKGWVAGQLRDTLQDLYAEALRINAGTPSLQYSSSTSGSTDGNAASSSSSSSSQCTDTPQVGSKGQQYRQVGDPASVLERLSGGSSASTSSTASPTSASGDAYGSPFAVGDDDCSVTSRSSGASSSRRGSSSSGQHRSAASSSAAFPPSHPLALLGTASSCLPDALIGTVSAGGVEVRSIGTNTDAASSDGGGGRSSFSYWSEPLPSSSYSGIAAAGPPVSMTSSGWRATGGRSSDGSSGGNAIAARIAARISSSPLLRLLGTVLLAMAGMLRVLCAVLADSWRDVVSGGGSSSGRGALAGHGIQRTEECAGLGMPVPGGW